MKDYRTMTLAEKCPHVWVYQPDPSGNNDSGYWCELCQKWQKRTGGD